MKLRLRDMLDNAENALITLWHVKENGNVLEGQDLLEVVTDKATFDVFSPCNGVLVNVNKKEGENIHTDEVLAEII